METLLQEMQKCLIRANDAYNESVDEFNEVFDQLEEAQKELAAAKEREAKDWDILQKQEAVIAASIIATQKDRADLNIARAQVKEYQRLDPKRLDKQNKGYKKTIADLKERLTASETARKQAIALSKKQPEAVDNTVKAFHFDPVTKNVLRVMTGLYVAKDNKYKGVPGSPVIEYIHVSSGISRQGTLLKDGTIGWASANNSMPSKDESRVAREHLINWCKHNKVKIGEAA